jgi:copper chaperone CopZ
MAMMFSGFGSMGFGAWGAMLIPMFGLLGMGAMMVVMYRNMSRMSAGMQGHDHSTMISRHGPEQTMEATQRATYSVPSISCGGCKQTIEGKIGQLEGVAVVNVDIAAKQASIAFGAPATDAGIVEAFEEIGYPVVAG